MIKANMTNKMIDFYAGNIHDIEHFLKVHAFASLICRLEQVDPKIRDIAEMAAIVHDIACPLCREKYGQAYGNRQEEESEALLRPFLEEYKLPEDVLERVIYLVCHHHTFTGIDGLDYQILIEADLLVNAAEGGLEQKTLDALFRNVFVTDAGKKLYTSMFGMKMEQQIIGNGKQEGAYEL